MCNFLRDSRYQRDLQVLMWAFDSRMDLHLGHQVELINV